MMALLILYVIDDSLHIISSTAQARGAFLRLRRWIVGGHALAAIAGICDPLGEHSVCEKSSGPRPLGGDEIYMFF